MKKLNEVNINAIFGVINLLIDDYMGEILPYMIKVYATQREFDSSPWILKLENETLPDMNKLLDKVESMRLYLPTRFLWLTATQFLEVSEDFKCELAKVHKLKPEMNLEMYKIRETIEIMLKKTFPLEVPIWQMLDQKKLKEALPLMKVVEDERKSADIPYQLEVDNWKTEVAIKTGDLELFFGSVNHSLELMSGIGANLDPTNLTSAIGTILQHKMPILYVEFTSMGKHLLEKRGEEFITRQSILFINWINGKICEEIAGGRIRSADEFKSFTIKGWGDLVDGYKKLNPFILKVSPQTGRA